MFPPGASEASSSNDSDVTGSWKTARIMGGRRVGEAERGNRSGQSQRRDEGGARAKEGDGAKGVGINGARRGDRERKRYMREAGK